MQWVRMSLLVDVQIALHRLGAKDGVSGGLGDRAAMQSGTSFFSSTRSDQGS